MRLIKSNEMHENTAVNCKELENKSLLVAPQKEFAELF